MIVAWLWVDFGVFDIKKTNPFKVEERFSNEQTPVRYLSEEALRDVWDVIWWNHDGEKAFREKNLFEVVCLLVWLDFEKKVDSELDFVKFTINILNNYTINIQSTHYQAKIKKNHKNWTTPLISLDRTAR